MRPGGLLLVVAGVWVLFQVMGGDALGRLGVLHDTDAPDKPSNDVDPLIPRGPDGGRGSTDGRGRPL